MTPVTQLRFARAKLAPPGAWIPVSAAARDAGGRVVQARSPAAASRGVLAALVAVTGPNDNREPALAALRSVTKAKHLCDWEEADGRTQAEVLDTLDRAVEQAEGDEWYGRAA